MEAALGQGLLKSMVVCAIVIADFQKQEKKRLGSRRTRETRNTLGACVYTKIWVNRLVIRLRYSQE